MSPRSYESMVENKIQEGMKKGLMDDLPGKGKPLNFDELYSKSEFWAANKILKNANILPKWLKLDKQIRESKAKLTEMIEKHGHWLERQKEHLIELKPAKRIELLNTIKRVHVGRQQQYLELVEKINPMIREMNLLVPVSRLQKMIIDEQNWKHKFDPCSKQYQAVLDFAEQLQTSTPSVWQRVSTYLKSRKDR